MAMFLPREGLVDAPLLANWKPTFRLAPCLVGQVSGHPLLIDGTVATSEVFAVDRQRRWARTFSRFYLLNAV
jgi:hypothetical protein